MRRWPPRGSPRHARSSRSPRFSRSRPDWRSRSATESSPSSRRRVPTPTLERVLKERVAALVGDELKAVEEEIRRQLGSPVALIQEMGGYIAGAGGKRLRPMLLLLASRLAGYRGPRSVRLACVVELLHTATLIHDDVVDQAPLRRGRPSADALDFVADEERFGKAIGSDLREGKRTLPLIAMLDGATAVEAERVRGLLKRPTLSASEVDEIRRLVLEHDGVQYARTRASSYAQAAKADLEAFPPSQEREILALIADFVVDRDR